MKKKVSNVTEPIENEEKVAEEVIKEEVKVAEEAPVEEKKEADKAPKEEKKDPKAPVAEKPIEIHPLSKDDPDIGDFIEGERKKILDSYKKSRKMSNIMMIICVLLIMGSIIMISMKNNNPGLMIGGYILAGVTLAALIVYYILTKNKFPSQTKAFIATYYSFVNRYLYAGKGFEGMSYLPKEKYDIQTVLCDRVYKDVLQNTSRNIVRGHFNGKPISIGELALYNAGAKRNTKSICFLGKYISYENSLHFEGRYIINIQSNAEKPVDFPTDIEGLVENRNGNVTIFSPDDKEAKAVLGEKFINEIKKIDATEPLFGLTVVVWAGHTAVYMSYDDPVMNIPFENEFKKAPQDKYLADLNVVLNALKGIAK